MCGIAGIIRFDGAPVQETALRGMALAMKHRGPDGDGVHVVGPVGFAHRRLAIIDPVGGQQPLIDDESGLAITYNGEVYNYVEIRRELGEAHFTTDCDTEVVLRAWRQWGPDALQRFRGMFAFAIHDPRVNKAFLVRDRLGIKPLYYRVTQNGVTFASELNAIAQGERLETDPDALSLYLRYGYVPAPYSIYKGVFKLEQGHFLTIDVASGKIDKTCYWQLDPALRPVEEGAALEQLDALLRETIKLYVRSDVPFGAFLSGGVDSSLVTALMSEALGGGVRTFSIGFDDERYSELPYAKEAADRLKTQHHQEVLSPDMSPEFLQRLAGCFGEPFSDSSALPTWLVSQVASRDVKMVLSGDGGDELFAGYNSYPAVARASKNAALAPIYQAVSSIAGNSRLGTFAAARSGTWLDEHHRQRDTFGETDRAALTGAGIPEQPDRTDTKTDPVTWCQARDVATYLPDDILTKVDRMSMAHSLEVRVPLLDHKIVEFAFSLPLDLRLCTNGGVTGKYLLKRAAERFFPRAFLDRKKWGFGIPLQKWLEGPLRPLVRDLLDSSDALSGAGLDGKQVRRIVREFYEGRHERVGQVWALLSLELWRAASGVRNAQAVH
ncbi:MAG: asparagine synthase (glutamine-hydrolyzing) [Rhizobiales bacterium]|nr:asparagine synthase (glutamine-hydrolyzing) [Hyphomicrobiales bacterium]